MWAAKIGAVAYALWSLLHIVLGISRLSERAADGALSETAGRLACLLYTSPSPRDRG